MTEPWYDERCGLLVVEPRADGLTGYVVGKGLRVGDHLVLARRWEGDVTAHGEVRTRWVESRVPLT